MAKSVLKFKDSVAAYEQLAGQIAARRFVPIYLLMGEESYFIDAIAEQIATTVLGEAERAFNQLTVYGRDSEAGQVINLCRQMPMLASMSASVMRFVPSGSETTSLPSSFEIFEMSVPRWSVSIDSAFVSMANPFPAMNRWSHEAIS